MSTAQVRYKTKITRKGRRSERNQGSGRLKCLLKREEGDTDWGLEITYSRPTLGDRPVTTTMARLDSIELSARIVSGVSGDEVRRKELLAGYRLLVQLCRMCMWSKCTLALTPCLFGSPAVIREASIFRDWRGWISGMRCVKASHQSAGEDEDELIFDCMSYHERWDIAYTWAEYGDRHAMRSQNQGNNQSLSSGRRINCQSRSNRADYCSCME